MALAALLGGSTLGTFGGILGWLFFGLTGMQALLLYLGLGLVLPSLVIVLMALRATSAAKSAAPTRSKSTSGMRPA